MDTYVNLVIGGLGGVIIIMLGAIWARVGKLDDKFQMFDTECRVRHEGVMKKEDYWREHIPLEKSVQALHSRLDKINGAVAG